VHSTLRDVTTPYIKRYFSSDPCLRRGFGRQEGGKTGVMPKHNAFMSRIRGGEDFSNAEQEEKNKYKCISI